ncbi:MAG: hypothetical protein QOF36_1474 [Microbacteriaceae bacterium]|nr:hypothetical protein [Microbacteriaceae bacterium]
MASIELTLIGKPGCHLCDDARDVIRGVLDELGEAGPAVTLGEVSILDDPELHDRYVEDIPVLLVNGVVHTYWRVDPARLRNALLETA